MAETWKGGQYRDYAVHARTDICEAKGCKPVIVTPIEDESLPHPGDGRNWTYYGARVAEILTPPVGPDGVVHLIWENGKQGAMRATDLRERKPEPEHEECPLEHMSDEDLGRRIREALS